MHSDHVHLSIAKSYHRAPETLLRGAEPASSAACMAEAISPLIDRARLTGMPLLIDISDAFVSVPFLRCLVREIVERRGLPPFLIRFDSEDGRPDGRITADIMNKDLADMVRHAIVGRDGKMH